MIKFILKFIGSEEKKEVFIDDQTFFDYSNGVDNGINESSDSDSANLILDLGTNDYKIKYSNSFNHVVLNHIFKFEINQPFFESLPIFKDLGLKEILENMEENSECKFNIFIFQDDVLMHNFKITIIRTPHSYVCLSSSIGNKYFKQISPRVLKSSSEAICFIQDKVIVYVNNSFANLISKSVEQLEGLKLYPGMNFPGADDNQLLKAFNDLNEGKYFYHNQDLKTKVNGVECSFKIFLSAMSYKNNPAVLLTAIDVTKQNLLNEISFNNNNEIQTFRSIGNIAVFKQKINNAEITWSPEYLTIMGKLPTYKSLKSDLFDYIIDEDKNLFEKTWIKSIRTKNDAISEFRIKNDEGKLKYLYLYSKIQYENNGKIVSINGFIQDRTEINESRYKLLNELDQRENAIKEMHYESQKILDNILNQTDLKLNTENFSPKFIVEKSQNRRNALNLIQEKIHESPNISSINVIDTLNPFIKVQLKFYNVTNVNFNVKVLANIFVSRKTMIILALIINEIIDNIIREVSTYQEEEVIMRVDLNVQKHISIFVETSVTNIYAQSDLSTKILKYLVNELKGSLKIKRKEFNTLIDIFLEQESV